jgi:hypothetical protein
MTRRSVALAFITGIAGIVIGRATVSRPVPSREPADVRAQSTPPACDRERAELRSTKAQLQICMHEPKRNDQSAEDDREEAHDRVRRNREVMATCQDYLVVRRTDGAMELFPPAEWNGEGLIVARKLPSGELGWYAGPDAGPRTDPAAFRAAEPGAALAAPEFGRAPDGTIMVNGEPGERSVQRMFGDPDASP